jgi:hypothetical protein
MFDGPVIEYEGMGQGRRTAECFKSGTGVFNELQEAAQSTDRYGPLVHNICTIPWPNRGTVVTQPQIGLTVNYLQHLVIRTSGFVSFAMPSMTLNPFNVRKRSCLGLTSSFGNSIVCPS